MTNYDLNRLGEKEFEHLSQSLIKKVIGVGTITFGDGPDGGREATYSGKAPYPSKNEQWDGNWIFQSKFHDLNAIGHDKSRTQILSDLKSELEKITVKFNRDCQNYIMITNVHLSSVDKTGTHDKISNLILDFHQKIPHIHVWGYDEVCRFLDLFADIRRAYFHFITPGDLLAELMYHETSKNHLAETIRLYIRTSIDREDSAKLDQAGQIDEKPLPLRKVFIDLDVKPRSKDDLHKFLENWHAQIDQLRSIKEDESTSAAELLTCSPVSKAVILGGPGQGKSTLSQYIAQIHRAYILLKQDELNEEYKKFTPNMIRIPFRILLKDFAQWMIDNKDLHNLENFLAQLVRNDSGGRDISPEDVQNILKFNPTLLILDGLDEVMDSELRLNMINQLNQFIGRSEDVLKADLQIIATSRPTGYTDQFDPSHFLHLSLVSMNKEKILEYTKKWIKAKGFDQTKGKNLLSSINDCLGDTHFSLLMNTPLQVTIFIFIILNGGTPPRQREELFDEYLEIIYKRERAKSKTIIQTEKRLLFGLHQYLGYVLHKRAISSDTRSRMDEEEFSKEVFNYLRHIDQFSSIEDLKQKAGQLIKEAHERLVLLVKLESDFFGFELRSIQEFFAACYLTDTASDSTQRFKRFQAIALPPHWRNVALFFAGRVGRSYPGEAACILEVCREIDRNKPDNFLKRGASLAFEIACDRSFEPNRMLQKSAIEYALSLLDDDQANIEEYDFIDKLSELTKEDIDHLVIPLLSNRLKNRRILNNFLILDVFHSICKNPSALEESLNLALEQGDISPRTILGKALEYELSPQYIESKFKDIFSISDFLDLISFKSIRSPEYIIEVLHHLGFPDSHALSLFDKLMYIGTLLPPPREIIEPPISKDLISQVILAAQLFIYSRNLHPTMDTKLINIENFLLKIDKLDQIVSDTSLIVELRSMSLSILCRAHLLQLRQTSLSPTPELISQFFSSLDSQQKELVERIFFHVGMPSIERIQSGLFCKTRDPSYHLQDFFHSIPIAGLDMRENDNIRLFILDPLKDEYIGRVLGTEWNSEQYQEKNRSNIIRVTIKPILGWNTRKCDIDPKFASNVIRVILSILAKKDFESWRAWTTLLRLTSISWNGKNGDLEKALDEFLVFLEQNTGLNIYNIELFNLLMRISESAMSEHITSRILYIFYNVLPNDQFWDMKFLSLIQRNFNIDIVQNILNTVISLNDPIALDGFLKWFTIASRLIEYASSEREPNRLTFDYQTIRTKFESAKGSVLEGAFLLLSKSKSIPHQDLMQILDLSKEGRYDNLDWPIMFNRIIQDLNQDEQLRLFENILPKHANYPQEIKYPALMYWSDILSNLSTDLQEDELGLPFQDIC
jgi:hypothetical protein